MSDYVVFEDYSVRCKEALKEKAIEFLYEIGGELRSRIQRNSRRATSQTAGSFQYKVDECGLVVHIGSNHQNAIWEEFGTGIHAIHKDGRKGGWYIPEEKLSAKAKSKMKKVIGKNGKVFYFTMGKTANRPMFKSYESCKGAIIRRAEEIFRGLNG